MHDFVEHVTALLEATSLEDAELISFAPISASFGDSEATFQLDNLLIHFIRDRGQEFVDIASAHNKIKFFQFTDIDIAMGWRTIDDVIAVREPENLRNILVRLKQNFSELNDAFSSARERFTRAKVERAARERGDAFMKHLREK